MSGGSGMSSRKILIHTSLVSDPCAIDKRTVVPGKLYDVYAPPGDLGIVIDTTADGHVMHSMKTNSPLINLIHIGDVVFAIDDMDTRSITAATLTRLIAGKAQQLQRKITLLNMGF
eukprot:CAMPEP_0113320146 /NCGR_PEP_ID=MMETSP0010_2-20120614/14063_1 /TAXON_ID=216773 ORGANISM="Corethron hystrix, Strain 308" /NCGR_SAMPLE_ID=MMETSP0010_2 /ASSEMBLY_ACC=CAM_ASM_000155 /LENGTH=115 /DNA_ID=CAMNT_0000177853 /DNA_START=351 /DNA_END=698 /DNA_ORIENTATION=+ /assembly_acc=CAM_ASM_000155